MTLMTYYVRMSRPTLVPQCLCFSIARLPTTMGCLANHLQTVGGRAPHVTLVHIFCGYN